MSFLSKLAKVGAFIIDAAADSAKSYERDAKRIAKNQERKMQNVNYDKLSSEKKEKYNSTMENIERLKNVDMSSSSKSLEEKASGLRDYAKNVDEKENENDY